MLYRLLKCITVLTIAAMKIAKERKSSVLASNAVHHRIDCLTSVVALGAIGGGHILQGASWLDPTGGLIVSLMVVRAGWTNTRAALLELADVGMDEEVKNSIFRAATKAMSSSVWEDMEIPLDNREIVVRNVQGIKAGQNYLIEVEMAVPGSWTINETRKVEDTVRKRIGSTVRGIRRVKVRFVENDNEPRDFLDEFIGPEISPRSSPEPEGEKETRPDMDSHDHTSDGDPKKRR